MPFDHSKSYRQQTSRETPLLLESRPVSLFNQYGKKRHETARPERKKFPQGDKSPDFVKCPTCNREPVDISYRKEGKKTYRIEIQCFYCGMKTLPFFPRLNIPVKSSQKLQRFIKQVKIEKQREYLDTHGEIIDPSLSIDDFLNQQNNILNDLLSQKITNTTLYVKGAHIVEGMFVCITDYKGDVLLHEKVNVHTTNTAELEAINKAVDILKDTPGVICSDNRMAVNLTANRWKTKHKHLEDVQTQIKQKLKTGVKIEWIPKWKNFANYQLEKQHVNEGSLGDST